MIKPHVTTKIKGQDKVNRLREILKKTPNAYVSIGVHPDAGNYDDGQSVIEVALWQEFGTEDIPSRSFIRSTVDENGAKFNQWREEMIENIVNKGWSVEKALEAIGFRIQVLIQNKIKSNVPPQLADSTAKAKVAKGRAPVTLIDSGLLLRSITFKVHV